MMGGDIRVRSESGKGTTFIVDLPVSVATETAPVRSEEEKMPADGKSRLVLVIDDDPEAAELLKRSLSKSGYGVVVAYSGGTGIEIMQGYIPEETHAISGTALPGPPWSCPQISPAHPRVI